MAACRSSFSVRDGAVKHTNGWRSASLCARYSVGPSRSCAILAVGAGQGQTRERHIGPGGAGSERPMHRAVGRGNPRPAGLHAQPCPIHVPLRPNRPADETPAPDPHMDHRLGCILHLEVQPPRTRRTAGCSSCVGDAHVAAEPHRKRRSRGNPAPAVTARGPARARSKGLAAAGFNTPATRNRRMVLIRCPAESAAAIVARPPAGPPELTSDLG